MKIVFPQSADLYMMKECFQCTSILQNNSLDYCDFKNKRKKM